MNVGIGEGLFLLLLLLLLDDLLFSSARLIEIGEREGLFGMRLLADGQRRK